MARNHSSSSPVDTACCSPPVKVRPRLRGIPDVAATFVALPAAGLLIARAHAGVQATAALVYGICLVLLFAMSATYHAFMWPLRVRAILKRFDHAMVYGLIAGSYTPVCLTSLPRRLGLLLLGMVWGMALLGVIKSFVWIHAPRRLTTLIYVAMGWVMLPFMPSVYRALGAGAFALLTVGGVVYTLGGLVYAHRWPNPAPRIFGYHEVFHLFVIAAGACHFATMWQLLT